MTSSVAALFVAAEEHRELPMPTWAYGLIAICCFAALLGVLWFFRHSAHKLGQHAHTEAPERG